MEREQNETIDFTDKSPSKDAVMPGKNSDETDTLGDANMADDSLNNDGISQEEDSPSTGRPRFHLNLHIFLIAAILIIAAISVYRLDRWNRGTKLNDDTEDVDTSQFDIEVLDMILPMDSSKLEGHEDDGVTTILCLGNNPFSDDRDKTGLASQIAAKTDAVVYDCAFPDSSAACKYPVYNPEYTKDHFNFFM